MRASKQIIFLLLALAACSFGFKTPALAQDGVPSSFHWAANLEPGQVTVIDGVVSGREPVLDSAYNVLVPGVPLNRQPDFALTPPPADTFPQLVYNLQEQTNRHLRWAAEYYGRSLPSRTRAQLRRLYQSTFARAQEVRQSGDAEREVIIEQLAQILADFVIAEARLFDEFPEAQLQRFGEIKETRPFTDTQVEDLERALQRWLTHDAVAKDSVGESPVRRQAYDPSRTFSSVEEFDELRFATEATLSCSSDTTVHTQWADLGIHTGDYEARIYRVSHPITSLKSILERLGVNSDFAYHSSVGAGIWALVKRHRITTYYERPCRLRQRGRVAFTVPMDDELIDRIGLRDPVKVDTSTVYYWTGQWTTANGAAGKYSNSDELVLVQRQWFGSVMEAWRWLYTPQVAADTRQYQPIRAAAYSAGTYGIDWVCHQTANAFGERRWAGIIVDEPETNVLYGSVGRKGISHQTVRGRAVNGCVPGTSCFYNVTRPWVSKLGLVLTPVIEWRMTGYGWNLHWYWDPNQNRELASGAKFTLLPPTWPIPAEPTRVEPGWQ